MENTVLDLRELTGMICNTLMTRSRGIESSRVYGLLSVDNTRNWMEPGMNVLDVGCGTGNTITELVRKTGVQGWGIDIDGTLFRENEQVRLISADAQALPFRDNSFDAIYSAATLQYVPDKLKALNEMRRVLKQRGRAIVDIHVPEHNSGVLFSPNLQEIARAYPNADITVPVYQGDNKWEFVDVTEATHSTLVRLYVQKTSDVPFQFPAFSHAERVSSEFNHQITVRSTYLL